MIRSKVLENQSLSKKTLVDFGLEELMIPIG